MTTTVPTTSVVMKKIPMTSLRRTSLTAGVLYLITFVSIPTLGLYKAVRQPDYILGAGPDSSVLVGGILEVIVALAGIGTAIALLPVVRKQNQSMAMGFVAARTLEAATIIAGVVSLLSIVTLRKTGAGSAALATARGFVAQHDWTFLLGQALIPGLNALLLGTLLYRSGLVPRMLPMLGLIGAPILFASVTAKYFGAYDEVSTWSLLGAAPIALWEFSLGVYLTVKGFRSCAITAPLGSPAAIRS